MRRLPVAAERRGIVEQLGGEHCFGVIAARIGTLPISHIPDQDCCQLFTPKHPSTRVRLDVVEQAEAALPIAAMVDAAVAGVAVEDFQFPVLADPVLS